MPYLNGEHVGGDALVRLGDEWQRKFIQSAEARGLAVENMSNQSVGYDLIVNGHRVQCKFRTPEKSSGTFGLCHNRRAGAKLKAYFIHEWDVLAVYCIGKLFIVPAADIAHKNGETIRNQLDPLKLLGYVDNWDIFSQHGGSLMQKCLPFMETPDAP